MCVCERDRELYYCCCKIANRGEKKCEECGNRLVVTSVLMVSFCVCIGILINFAGERKCEESRP